MTRKVGSKRDGKEVDLRPGSHAAADAELGAKNAPHVDVACAAIAKIEPTNDLLQKMISTLKGLSDGWVSYKEAKKPVAPVVAPVAPVVKPYHPEVKDYQPKKKTT